VLNPRQGCRAGLSASRQLVLDHTGTLELFELVKISV
jgi:energy-converting hydrogenase Eha subunit H